MGESSDYISALSCGHYSLIQHLHLQEEHIDSSNLFQISGDKMAAHLEIRYYECRNGLNIPLVPADLLPFRIEGLSWPLSGVEVAMEGWHRVGETNQPTLPLRVFPRQHVQFQATGFVPYSEKGRYCTFWIRHGTCEFEEQCCYVHEMPDRKKLKVLGFDEYPRWYKLEHPDLFNAPENWAAPSKNEMLVEKKRPVEMERLLHKEKPVQKEKKKPVQNEKREPIQKETPIEKESPTKKERPTQNGQRTTGGVSELYRPAKKTKGTRNVLALRSGPLRMASHALQTPSSSTTLDPPLPSDVPSPTVNLIDI